MPSRCRAKPRPLLRARTALERLVRCLMGGGLSRWRRTGSTSVMERAWRWWPSVDEASSEDE